MTSIWIVTEDPLAGESLAFRLSELGRVATGAPERSRWPDEAGVPDLMVLVGADEPGGELVRLERLLEFVRRVVPYRRAAPPVLYVEPAGGHPAAELVARLIDDRPLSAVEWPVDAEELLEAARQLLGTPTLPESLRERARRDWIQERMARCYAGLELPSLRHAVDPRNASRPLLLCGEPGTGRGLVARYIHGLAEPTREALVLLAAASLPAGEVEPRVLARTVGRRVTVYLDGLDAAAPAVQDELAHLLGQSGLLGYEPVRWIASVARPRRLVRALRELPWLRVDLPPLRARADLPELVRGWVRAFGQRTGRRLEVDPAVPEALARYAWPGNLAELEAVLAASVTRVRGEVLGPEDLALRGAEPEPVGDADAGAAEAPGERAEAPGERAEAPGDGTEAGGDRAEAAPGDSGAAPDEPKPGVRYETGEPIALDPAGAPGSPQGDAAPTGPAERDAGAPEPLPDTKPAAALSHIPEIEEIVAPLAHEIREPLLAIRTYANLLEQRPSDESVRRELSQLVDGDLGRIDDTLHRLERFAGFGEPSLDEVSLGQLVGSEIERRRGLMRERSLVILEELERDSPPARADEEQLRFAVGGLLDRALRMVPPGGDLYIGSLYRPAGPDARAHQRVLIRFHSPEDVLVTPEGVTGPPMPLEVVIAKTLVTRMGGAFAVDASGTQDNVILLELPA